MKFSIVNKLFFNGIIYNLFKDNKVVTLFI